MCNTVIELRLENSNDGVHCTMSSNGRDVLQNAINEAGDDVHKKMIALLTVTIFYYLPIPTYQNREVPHYTPQHYGIFCP